MELTADARIPFPPAVVFAACRDDMAKLLPYLPSVRSIEVTSRTEDGSVVRNVLEWRGGGNIPRPLRAVLSDAVLSWTDHATWYADALQCDWYTKTHAFPEAVRCGARDRFLPDGDGTLLEIRGKLVVDGKKLPAVPSVFAARIGKAMEEFLVSKIQSDLVKTADGLAKLLAQDASHNGTRPA
jgi:hypothetical protein